MVDKPVEPKVDPNNRFVLHLEDVVIMKGTDEPKKAMSKALKKLAALALKEGMTEQDMVVAKVLKDSLTDEDERIQASGYMEMIYMSL